MPRCAPYSQDPTGCPLRCLSRLLDADRPTEGQGRYLFMTIIIIFYFLFAALAAGGAGRARLRQDPAGGGGNRSVPGEPREPRWLLPPLLHVGASAAFRRERAGGTIRVTKRGARRGRDSPGRE